MSAFEEVGHVFVVKASAMKESACELMYSYATGHLQLAQARANGLPIAEPSPYCRSEASPRYCPALSKRSSPDQ